MTANEQHEQKSAELGQFAKMVRKQLKKGYSIDVGRFSQKIDLHNQPKAVVRIGSGDDKSELWFREGDDGSIIIDKMVNGNWDNMLEIKKPICHLRTSAKLATDFNLPKAKDDDGEIDFEISESVEIEPEDFEEEFTAPSNKFAIVDASVLDGIDNELIDNAIVVPIKHRGAIFNVIGNYDDTILRSLNISPAEVDQDGIETVKTTKLAEGVSPLSHDNSIERRLRKTVKGIRHEKGQEDEVPVRVPEPTKVTPKRDKSKKDQRKKTRESERPSKQREAAKMRIGEDANTIIALIGGDDNALDQLTPDDLHRIGQYCTAMLDRPELSEVHSRIKLLNEDIVCRIQESKPDASAIVEFVECLKKKKISSLMMK